MNWELEPLLRSQQAGELLAAALASSGLDLQDWALERVYSRPGEHGTAEVSARFRVRTQGAEVTLIASTRELSDDQRDALGAVRCESPTGTLHVWAHPVDPELPGLAVAEDPSALAQRLGPLLGVEVEVAAVQMLVLRPLRRAVYRVRVISALGERTVYLKVVRPRRAGELLARHQACRLAPRAADAGDGVVVIEQAAGRSVTDLLHRPTSPAPGVRIAPEAVLTALESLAPSSLQFRPRPAPAVRHRSFAPALSAMGADPARLARLSDRIDAALDPDPSSEVPTHGDFHPGNLFLTEDGTRPAALIDADTIGPGNRADDLAIFFAHLTALPSFDASGYQDVPVLAAELWEAAGAEAADLPGRIAAGVLSLAPGAGSAAQLEQLVTAAETVLDKGINAAVRIGFSPNAA